MFTEQEIANLIRKLATAKGWKVTYAARLVSGSGDTVARLEGGIGLTLRRAKQIVEQVAREWPETADWPKDIPRPTDLKDAS